MLGRARLFGQGDTASWRVFDITIQVRVLRPRGATRVWLPTPLAVAPYQNTMGDTYHPGNGTAVMIETTADDPDILGCAWDDGVDPAVTLVSRIATTGYAVSLTTPSVAPLPDHVLARFLKPTRFMPTDGSVRTTAETIVRGAGTDLERARAIYGWIVEHVPAAHGTHEEANTRFVGLCRAAGIPSRVLYGLALSSGDATKNQQCRAEVYLTGYGWVPIDPARGATGFGAWKNDWIAYNFAHDVQLRGSTRKPLAFLMYPQGETGDGPLDSLDAEHFTYAIAVDEVR